MILVLICLALGIAALVIAHNKLIVRPLRRMAKSLSPQQRDRLRYGYAVGAWHRGQSGMKGYCRAHDRRQLLLLPILGAFALFFYLALNFFAPIEPSETSSRASAPPRLGEIT